LAQKFHYEFFPGGKFGQVVCREAAYGEYPHGFWEGDQTTAKPRLADSGEIGYSMLAPGDFISLSFQPILSNFQLAQNMELLFLR